MADKELLKKTSELSDKISKLPKGYISQKNISGKIYYYHQWSENGKKQSKYLRDDEVEPLAKLIDERKAFQHELRDLRAASAQGNRKRDEVIYLKCTLMHKNVPVAEIELDDETGFIQKIDTLYAPRHLPIGVPVRQGLTDRKALNDWWTERSIPASRSGVREALETLEITNTKMLLVRCWGLSLSDQYWIRPEGSERTWNEINFFNNDFSEDIGDVLFGADKKANALNFASPDNTSDGNLKKRWKIIDGKRCLVKGGSNPYRQQPFNEVIAGEVMERLGIPHIKYTLAWNKGAPYSICEDFVDENTELVPAWRIYNSQKKNNSMSAYQHFVKCCEDLGIRDAVPFLDRMIALDYLIANEDRHLNNFGVLRNAETLEWLGFAPIYDSGSSLGYDKLPHQILKNQEITCKPFKNHHEEQLKLVSSFDWLKLDRLSDVRELIAEVFSSEGAGDYIDEARIAAITASVERRMEHLYEIMQSQLPDTVFSTEDDVEENIAEDYFPKMTM